MNLIFALYLLSLQPASGEILEKTAASLNSFTSVEYVHERDYFTGEKHYVSKGTNYINFVSTDSIAGVQYRIVTDNHDFIFNGTETFTLNKKELTLELNSKPVLYQLSGGSYINNSLITLRRTLPLIAADKSIGKTISDTSIGGTSYHLVRFTLTKKTLADFGGYFPIRENRNFQFKLIVRKDNYLPYKLIQTNDADEHTSTISYTNIKTDASINEESLFYSTYLPKYSIVTDKASDLSPLAVGTEAPRFELPDFATGKTVESKNYKHKLVLVEFWIRNCGPCIESVPYLNELLKKYSDKGLEIVGINAFDAKPTVDYFLKKYKPAYTILYQGEKVAKQYGVDAFPTAFVVNQNGEIIYSGGFDHDAIKAAIEKALK